MLTRLSASELPPQGVFPKTAPSLLSFACMAAKMRSYCTEDEAGLVAFKGDIAKVLATVRLSATGVVPEVDESILSMGDNVGTVDSGQPDATSAVTEAEVLRGAQEAAMGEADSRAAIAAAQAEAMAAEAEA